MEIKLLLPAFIGLVALSSCKKEEPATEPDLGYGYFPTVTGTWVEYQVDSLWRDDPSNVRDSVSYRLLERIVEQYTDLEGRTCQRIHRFVRNEAGEWVVRDVWSATTDASAAERTEENYRKLKLSFPVRLDRRWDINALGTSAVDDPEEDDELEVEYDEVDEPWSNTALSFERTLLVKNTVPANFVEKRNFEERYAHGVGMVEKYQEETNTQLFYPPTGPPVPQVRGWRLRMTAVAYGTE
ncbi:MAG: hypothetical protein ACO1NQ_03880 [Flavobacteriales bacterium]